MFGSFVDLRHRMVYGVHRASEEPGRLDLIAADAGSSPREASLDRSSGS
jgi:hypothetical protein